MFFNQSCQILRYTGPILVAQLASISMTIIDSVLLGHFNTEDLAAVAVGGGIYIALLLALAGVAQAIAPITAHLKGAQKDSEIAGELQQAIWLALFLSLPGIFCLYNPDVFFIISPMDQALEIKARQYLIALAWGVPAALLYRTFYAFCNALGKPLPFMVIALCGALLHGFLAWILVNGHWSKAGIGLGVLGCGISNATVNWFVLCAGLTYLAHSKTFQPYKLFTNWKLPKISKLRELIRLGLPIGLSSFIEVSSFTFSAVLVAQLGATIVAGHRIVLNLAAIGYMLPLSLSIATLALVGHAVGAKDWMRAKITSLAGIAIAAALSGILSLILWLSRDLIVGLYTNDINVHAIAVSLIIYIVLYQVFDAIQAVAAFSLRGYKITFVPMLVHLICFWGIGLFGGWWLAFRAANPMGVTGFWLASLSGLIVASLFLGALLYWRTTYNETAKN